MRKIRIEDVMGVLFIVLVIVAGIGLTVVPVDPEYPAWLGRAMRTVGVTTLIVVPFYVGRLVGNEELMEEE